MGILRGIAGVLRAGPLAAAAGVAYSAAVVDHDLPLPSPLAAEPTLEDVAGRGSVAFYRRGPVDAPPVLLVHSVNAAASSAEMRPLFDELSHDSAVTAVDLPGYGRSDRLQITYDIDTMTAGVVAALESIDRPSHVVALSLGAEFAARAELLRPDLVASLTLISPTGFRTAGPSRAEWLGTLLRTPVLGQALFDALTSRVSIEYFLGKSFVGEVDPALASYAYISAHQPNARFAPAVFLSGSLFTQNVREELYGLVAAPTQVLFDQDAYSSFEELAPFTSQQPNWTARRIANTRGLPHFDATAETVKAIREFIDGAGN